MDRPLEQPQKKIHWLWGAGLILLGLIFVSIQLTPGRMDDLIPIVIMSGFVVTFYVIYSTNRERRWPLIPMYFLGMITGGVLLDVLLSPGGLLYVFHRQADAFIGSYLLVAFSIPFVYFYTRSRKAWLLVPPAILLAILGGITLDAIIYSGPFGLLRRYDDALMAGYLCSVFAVPFVFAYVKTRQTWALFFLAMLAAIAGGVIIDNLIYAGPLGLLRRSGDDLVGAYVTAVLALPMIALYRRNKRRWFALVVGGLMLSISAGLVLASAAAFIPVLMIGVGVFLLIRRQRMEKTGDLPLTGPQADHPPDHSVVIEPVEANPVEHRPIITGV